MKTINGKELGFMPNGTVFSDIIEQLQWALQGCNDDSI